MNNTFTLPSGERIDSASKATLLDFAKLQGVVGRWGMNKAQLISAILTQVLAFGEWQEHDVQDDWENDRHLEMERNAVEESITVIAHVDTKATYRDNAKIGTLVAFRMGPKLMTAKIIDIHGDKLNVQTKRGTKIQIEKSDVSWFKTGDRWPRAIFEELTSGRR